MLSTTFRAVRGVLAIGIVAFALTGCGTAGVAAPASAKPSDQASAMKVVAGCMNKLGWSVTSTGDSVQSGNVPNAQRSRYLGDLSKCEEDVFPDQSKFSAEQWKASYDLAIRTADCLARNGKSVESRPSLQAYVDGNGAWNPYNDLFEAGQLTPSELQSMQKKCPQPNYWPN